MFRDLKEYQELQKLYEEKVSKTEELDEGIGEMLGGIKDSAVKQAEKLGSSANQFMKKNEPIKKLRKAVSDIKIGSSTDGNKKFKPFKALAPKKPIGSGVDTSSEIESDANYAKSNARFNQNFKDKNTDTSSEIESDANYAKSNKNMNRINKFGKSSVPKPVKSPMETGMGDGAAKARLIAKERIKSGKTIADVKAENSAKIKQNMQKRNAAFQKRREEFRKNKKAGISNSKPQPEVKSPMATRGESYEPYDIVLEYLLTSQQAATIEEANYIMTEMDAKTIQDIVSQQLNEQN